jgi:hypothetical protein
LRGYRAIIVAAGLGAVLAACGPDIPSDEPGTPVSPAALPHPKAGLWAWISQAGGQKRICLSGQLLSVLAERPGCPLIREIRTFSGAFVVIAQCQDSPVRRTWARCDGDYTKAFSVDTRVDDTRGDVSDHADYRYLGPCPPGQHPVDQP